MSVIDEIAAERRRQIEVEGWTPGPSAPTARDREAAEPVAEAILSLIVDHHYTQFEDGDDPCAFAQDLAPLIETIAEALAAREAEVLAWAAGLVEADRLTITPPQPVPAAVAEDMYTRGQQRLAALILAGRGGG